MSKKRIAGRYIAAGSLSALYAGAVAIAYKEQGSEPVPNDWAKVKRIAITAAALTGLTWLAAVL